MRESFGGVRAECKLLLGEGRVRKMDRGNYNQLGSTGVQSSLDELLQRLSKGSTADGE